MGVGCPARGGCHRSGPGGADRGEDGPCSVGFLMGSASPVFVLAGRRLLEDARGVTCTFRLGDDVFTEEFRFGFDVPPPVDGAAIERLLDVVLVCVGVSYYKVAMGGRIVSEVPLHAETAALVPHLYDHGLRELAVRNGLAVPHVVTFDGPLRPTEAGSAGVLRDGVDGDGPARSLLPFGGGKDSTFTLSLLDDVTALSIHATDVQRRVAAAAGVTLLEVDRTLDPLLAIRTAEGGLNGHVPITAINSSVSAVVAALCGFDEVVLANERSSEEPTLFVDGVPVNHQYSKSFAFEQVLAAALAPAGVRYFSMVRAWSELAIAGALAPKGVLRNAILSCNRAFSLTRTPTEMTWCRNCAKCRFTFLSFAVFSTPEEMVEMFGGNMLDDRSQLEGFRALWSDKPFDCVGELAESAIAMAHVAAREEWADAAVVQALAADAAVVADASGTSLDRMLEPRGPDAVPARYRARLAASVPRSGSGR